MRERRTDLRTRVSHARVRIEAMNLPVLLAVLAAIAALTLITACGASADGDSGSDTSGEDAGLTVTNVWSRPVSLPEGDASATGVVYLTIENGTDETETLTGARSSVAGAVEIHETQMDDGVMRMRQVTDGLEIPGGESVAFEPGGYHIMLVNLNQDLNAGDTFQVELNFENAGSVTVESEVREQ